MTLALAGTLLSGCVSKPKPSAPPPPRAIVTADHSRVATVAMYDAGGRFVVLNFTGTQPPPNGSVLFIYRDGLKAGEVNIIGPRREDNVVADLISGEARVGDEVRDQ
jgi:hypothetical protein